MIARHLDFTHPLTGRRGTPPHPPAAVGGGHLTERELIILRYLPTMFKAAEIAKDLYLSVNTVKAHLPSIYRKLDVTSRREAVERPAELSLL